MARTPSKDRAVGVSVSLPHSILKKVRILAGREKMTPSAFVRRATMRYIDAQKQEAANAG